MFYCLNAVLNHSRHSQENTAEDKLKQMEEIFFSSSQGQEEIDKQWMSFYFKHYQGSDCLIVAVPCNFFKGEQSVKSGAELNSSSPSAVVKQN